MVLSCSGPEPERVGEFSTSLTLMKAVFKNNQRPNRYRALRWGWVNPLGGNYWNNGVTYFPALAYCVFVCMSLCVRELGGGEGGLSDRWVGHICFLLSRRYLPEHSTQECYSWPLTKSTPQCLLQPSCYSSSVVLRSPLLRTGDI